MTFTNGTRQTFQLRASITQPFIELDEASSAAYDFGKVHQAQGEHAREIGLTNPSNAAARWSIKHQPVKLTAQEIARRRAQMLAGKAEDEPEDDGAAFEFASMSGTLPPMHGELPARVPLSVRFTPQKPGKFRATYLFRVAKGFPAKVTLSGEATLLEENMDVIVNEQHLRLMQPGTLGY